MHSSPIMGHMISLLLLIGPIIGLTIIDWNLFELMLGGFIGIVYWSFFEYAMHRFIYHRIFKAKIMNQFWQSFHLYHHRNIKEKSVLNANYLFILPMAILNTLVLFVLCFFNINVFLFGIISLVMSYMFYEWVHYSIHMNPFQNSYIKNISKYHLHHHHRSPLKNFGNTSSLWDRVLGTYDSQYKELNLHEVEY
jgi:sterol desaturase/sphingolipid hydroxylase (fatty acid hydroxylase superfamily)